MLDFVKFSELLTKMNKPPRIAPTPSRVIYRENKLRVLHYKSKNKPKYQTPLVIVNSLINKYYILDLMPGKSFVSYLVEQGFQVYMVDWGVPDDADCEVTLEDHINRYLPNIVRKVGRHTGSDQVSLLGYCMGGTMAMMYAALHPDSVKNLILLATPVDFENDSLLSQWARPDYFDVDAFVDAHGNAPVEVLKSTFMMLKPTKNITKYTSLLENMDNEEFVQTFMAFDYWVNDAVPVAGETFRKFIKDCYQKNLLKKNRFKLDGQLVRLKNITSPTLNILAEHDDIVPPKSAEIALKLIASTDKTELRVKGGHHGVSIGPNALGIVWPKTVAWLAERDASMPQGN